MSLLFPTATNMRPTFQLAAALLTALAASSHAQVQNELPTPIQSPPSLAPTSQLPRDISWLWQYTTPAPRGNQAGLTTDPRFLPFLKRNLTAPQSFWQSGEPLPDVAHQFLTPPGRVLSDANRYLSADGRDPDFRPERGLLWVDTGLADPLVLFAAIDWIKDNRATDDPGAAYTLWLFPNRPLDPAHLRPALVHSLARWTAQPVADKAPLPNITRVILVNPDGSPHTIAPADAGAHNTLTPETTTESTAPPKAQP